MLLGTSAMRSRESRSFYKPTTVQMRQRTDMTCIEGGDHLNLLIAENSHEQKKNMHGKVGSRKRVTERKLPNIKWPHQAEECQ